MAVQDRIERYSKIRAWLDYPKSQQPRPHQILNQMCVDEQWLNLRLSNENEPWNLIYKDLATVAGTGEYTITQPVTANQQSGKPFFVARSTAVETEPYVVIPFEDMTAQVYGEMQPVANTLARPEKLIFYRSNMQDQSRIVIVAPTPQEVLTYRIWFHTGQLDRAAALMGQTSAVTEISDFLDLKTTLALLPYCEWSDIPAENDAKRRTLLAGLQFQYNEMKEEALDYIDNMAGDADFSLGYALDR